MTKNLKFLCFLLLGVITKNSFSQSFSTIEGKVIDSSTKEPLPFASVYLAKTSIGAATGMDGTFLLDKIPPGKYDLTISMVGYKTISKSYVFSGVPTKDLLIALASNPKELDAVTVLSSKIKRSKSAFDTFKKFFLGETRNAFSCKILNPDDIFAYKEKGKLLAVANKPIEIENTSLGYKIIYELKEFEVDYQGNRIITSGIPRFENLVPKNESQKNKWILARDRAYYGSIEHFLKSLLHHELAKNYFRIKDTNGNTKTEAEIIKENYIIYSGALQVTYINEQNEMQASRYVNWEQNSKIELNGIPVKVFDNGNYEEFRNLFLDGYFGWTSHIGDLIPYDYQPIHDITQVR